MTNVVIQKCVLISNLITTLFKFQFFFFTFSLDYITKYKIVFDVNVFQALLNNKIFYKSLVSNTNTNKT